MIDLFNQSCIPTLEEISAYIRNPVFDRFCEELRSRLGAAAQLTFSKCSFAPGWNVKFRKSGRGLCTVYPDENRFTVLVVIGQKEKERVEAILPECAPLLREIYKTTREGSGQRWMMIDLEDEDQVYRDTLRLIEIRNLSKKQKM